MYCVEIVRDRKVYGSKLVHTYSLSEKERCGGIRSLDAIVKVENFSSKLMLKKEKSNAEQNRNLQFLI